MYRRAAILSAFVAFVALVGGWWYVEAHSTPEAVAAHYQTQAEASNVYVRFDMEAYDAIMKNYWQTPTNAALANLFLLSVNKATGKTFTLATTTRAATASLLENAFAAATSTSAKQSLATNVLSIVLYNLPPAGRDKLLSKTQETALRNEVSNVHPNQNLYSYLGLAKGASVAQVNTAYTQKEKTLAATTSASGKQELAQVQYAHQVLSHTQSKQLYDTHQIQPTVFTKIMGHTLYVNMTQIAPTTLYEFATAIEAASSTPGLNSMIIDLRGNIGGALDFATAFLGLFIGNHQYAYDLYAHNAYDPQRTTEPRFPALDRYKEIALLTNGLTQSTAEVTTAEFKRYHLATVVGTTTRGWGTVEDTYPLKTEISTSTSYALLLVNHITLSDTNQPIQGHGVVPNVDTAKPGWQKTLGQYFALPSMITAVRTSASEAPQRN